MFFEHQMYVRDKLAEFEAQSTKRRQRQSRREREVAAVSSDVPEASPSTQLAQSQQALTAEG